LRVLQLVASLRAALADHPFWTFAAIAIVWNVATSRARTSRAPGSPSLAPFGSPPRAPVGSPPRATVGSPPRAIAGSPRLATAAVASAVGLYIGIAIWYVFVAPSYYDFAEPSVACIAWLFDRGLPIYHAFDAAERYSHIYGPLAFILPGWFLAAIGPGIVASKAVGVLAGVLSLLVSYRLMRSATTTHRALALTGLLALLCLTYRNASFWIRPDSFSLLFASLSLLVTVHPATSRHRWLAAAGLGICTGLLVNLKLTGALYALPAFALLGAAGQGPQRGSPTRSAALGWESALPHWREAGRALPLALAAATAAVVASAPFVAFSNVSLGNYLTWVRISAGNGLLGSVLKHNVEWTLFLLLPLAPTLTRTPAPRAAPVPLAAPPPPIAPPLTAAPAPTLSSRARTLVYSALLAGIVAVAIAASKPGAGPYHLMPFLPAVLYLVALHNDDATSGTALSPGARVLGRARGAFVLATVAVASLQQLYFIGIMNTADASARDAADDLAQFAETHPGRAIAVGYANAGERSTFARPALVFRTGRYPIDAPAVQEFQMSGLDLPPATMDALRRCDVEMWLIPKGATPFDGPNTYPAMHFAPLFSDAFKHAFFDTYAHERASDTRDFDVWRCPRPLVAPRPGG
jgi:hypothetical protein